MLIDSAVQTLLANLIGDNNRLLEMSYQLEPEDLPDHLPWLKVLLGAIRHCGLKQYPPTPETVQTVLVTQFNMNEKTASHLVTDILEHQTDSRDVRVLSGLIHEDLVYRTNRNAISAALDEYEHGIGDASTRLNSALSIIATAQRAHDEAYILRGDGDIADAHEKLQRQRARNRREGAPPGPSLKFRGFVGEPSTRPNVPSTPGKIPHLTQGDTVLITGQPGTGKTTLGSVWAEHNAWVLGYNVLYLHNETDQGTIFDRMYSRHTLIRSDYLSSGRLDPDDLTDPLTQKYLGFSDWLKKDNKYNGNPGHLHYCYCPSWTHTRLEAEITFHRQVAQEQGRALLVIMDYYNLVSRIGVPGSNKAEQLGWIGLMLRERVKVENALLQHATNGKNGVTMIVFSQETVGTDGTVYPYGSKEILQYSQVHITIQRERAKTDSPILLYGDHALDAGGNPRYYHRVGEWAGPSVLQIEKANNGSPGPVEICFENALSIVTD